MPVHVDNDANCAALGEAWFGAGREYNSFVGLTLGTGVGSGIIINRKVHTGDHGFGGEFGHVSIDYNGPLCGCGNRGCVEAYIGNSYLSAEAVRVLREAPGSQLHQCAVETPGLMTPLMLSEAADAGDQAAYGVLRNAGRMLGYCVASVANLLDITTFIIGGGVSAAGAPLFEGIESAARERTLIVHRNNLLILPAALGNDAGMLGAAALAAL
jgi:glucokinase